MNDGSEGSSPAAFELQPGEGHRAYAAFVVYRDLGPHRTLVEAARRTGKSVNTLAQWSRRHAWGARVAAFAAHMAGVEQAAREAAVRGQFADWSQRQQLLREEEWSLHEECVRAGRAGLKRFMEKKREVSLGEIARLLDLASKLGRLATGLTTENIGHAGQVNVNLQLEIESAIKKVYGTVQNAEVIEGDEPNLLSAPKAT